MRMFLNFYSAIILSGVASLAKGQQDCSSSQSYYTPSHDKYIASYFNLSTVNGADGPSSVSAAPSTTSTTSLTLAELKYYNYFAVSMYCPTTLPDLTCCYCAQFNATVTYHKLITNTVYDTLVLVTLHPNKSEIVVTFRGSKSIMNFMADAFILPITKSPNIQIHRGFHLSLMSVYNQIVAELQPLITANPSYRVVSTGHSLGGSMASLFIYFLNSLNQFTGTNYVLVTYGQVRTGNKGYADYMNALTIPMARVVARADFAPHFVPVSFFGTFQVLIGLNYVHHTQEVWINGGTTIFCSKSQYEDFSCSNSMGLAYTLFDHGQYFDADYSTCYVVEGWGDIDFFTLPNGFKPSNYLPPMPSKMYNSFNSVFQGGYQGLLPLL